MANNISNQEKVLSVKDLVISFKTDKGIVHAVRGVSFDLYKGETLCIVGESGSGKSVTNKAIMGISANNAIIENGSIIYEGEDLIRTSEEEFHRIRGHKIGMIFQDPLSALNPVVRIGKQITEATLINKDILKKHYRELISKELVAYRNAEANKNFIVRKNKEEILELKNRKALYLKDVKKHNEEAIQKHFSYFNKYYLDLKTFNKSERERLTKEIEKANAKIAKETNKEKMTIREIKLANLKNLLSFNEALTFEEVTIGNIGTLCTKRIASLKAESELNISNFKKLVPLLKKALQEKKKVAKLETKNYGNELKNKRDEKLAGLNKELDGYKNELKLYFESLSDDEKNKINEILKHNSEVRKKLAKLAKTQQGFNISSTTKKDENEILKTKNDKYDELVEKISITEKEIEKVNEEYINKTKVTKAEAKKMALKVMKEVGIPMPERRFRQYPFEFSGGMRQRIVIAIALTANPDILICDEPTTALDVTIQAQILELINRLKVERNLSCIFITHDLGVVANMADRVAVMYAGKIVEYGSSSDIFFDPRHPYTWALLSSIPDIDSKEKLEAIPGTPPDMRFPPKGDAFALRSKYAMAIDFKYEPPFFKVSDTHYAATWLLYNGAPKVEMPAIVKTRIANALKEEKLKKGAK